MKMPRRTILHLTGQINMALLEYQAASRLQPLHVVGAFNLANAQAKLQNYRYG